MCTITVRSPEWVVEEGVAGLDPPSRLGDGHWGHFRCPSCFFRWHVELPDVFCLPSEAVSEV